MDYKTERYLAQREELAKQYGREKNALLVSTLKKVAPLAALTALLLTCSPPAQARDREVEVLTLHSGQKTPVGGVGVYSSDFGKRVGTVETLGDGSTILRGDFGKVVAKSEPRRSASEPLRVTVRGKR